jgi:hypothetical protein
VKVITRRIGRSINRDRSSGVSDLDEDDSVLGFDFDFVFRLAFSFASVADIGGGGKDGMLPELYCWFAEGISKNGLITN